MDKLRQRQEIQAYRIVRRNILKITNSIPFDNMTLLTYPGLIYSNVKLTDIREMYKEMYLYLVPSQYKRIERSINKAIKTKAEINFEAIILEWLNSGAGQRIVSVHQTLIDTIINVIANGYEDNLSVADITKRLQNTFGWYRYQALRIARTETTTATNFATNQAGQNSDYLLIKTWISTQDSRTRRPPESHFDHLDMNGVKVDSDKPFFVGGETMYFPGDPKGSAGNVVNCRCGIVFTAKQDADGLPIRKIK